MVVTVPATEARAVRSACNLAPPDPAPLLRLAVRVPLMSTDRNRCPIKLARELNVQVHLAKCPLFVRTLGARAAPPSRPVSPDAYKGGRGGGGDAVAPAAFSGGSGEVDFPIPVTIMKGYEATLNSVLDARGQVAIGGGLVTFEQWLRGLILPAAKGLAVLHGIGLAHRGLSGLDILCDRHGGIAIGDFGYTKAVDSSRMQKGSDEGGEEDCAALALEYLNSVSPLRCMPLALSHAAHVPGSFWYAAPEALLCADPSQFDERALDVFSLGVAILGALLGGVGAYGRATIADQIVHYFSVISQYDDALWGTVAEAIGQTFPETCAGLRRRLQTITHTPLLKAANFPHCPALVALLRRMLAADPRRRATIAEVLNSEWFVGAFRDTSVSFAESQMAGMCDPASSTMCEKAESFVFECSPLRIDSNSACRAGSPPRTANAKPFPK